MRPKGNTGVELTYKPETDANTPGWVATRADGFGNQYVFAYAVNQSLTQYGYTSTSALKTTVFEPRFGYPNSPVTDWYNEGKQLVRLENNPKLTARLLMAPQGARCAKPEDFTPLHVGIPSWWRLFSSRLGPPD